MQKVHLDTQARPALFACAGLRVSDCIINVPPA